MLYSFAVKNYRSIRDSAELEFSRSSVTGERSIEASDSLAKFDVNPVAALMGPNASGKSTILHALATLCEIVSTSADRSVKWNLPHDTFAFDDADQTRPTRFTVRFGTEINDYLFEVEFDKSQILYERLVQITLSESGRASRRQLYVRTQDRIKTSRLLKGAKKHIVDATRPNMLFLSKAAKENLTQLLDPFLWFSSSVLVGAMHSSTTISMFKENHKFRTWAADLIQAADLGISALDLQLPATRPPRQYVEALAEQTDMSDLREVEELMILSRTTPRFTHTATYGALERTAAIPWAWESAGTKNLWDTAGAVFDALDQGGLLLVDEFAGMHPMLERAIIMLFQSRETNPRNAQLVFTTHNTALLGDMGNEGRTLAADQVWFTEKGMDGATALWPLTDFRLRKAKDLQSLYLAGRFDALPLIDGFAGVHE